MIATPTARPASEKRCFIQNDGRCGAISAALARDQAQVSDSACARAGGALESTAILQLTPRPSDLIPGGCNVLCDGGGAGQVLVIVNGGAATDHDVVGAKGPHRARRTAERKLVVRRVNCADEGRTAAVSPVLLHSTQTENAEIACQTGPIHDSGYRHGKGGGGIKLQTGSGSNVNEPAPAGDEIPADIKSNVAACDNDGFSAADVNASYIKFAVYC